MIERKESGGMGARKHKSDPRLDDPPKPVVYAGEDSALAAKIAKLTERLAVTSPTESSAAPPALLTSGSLNEARAYLPQVQPVAGEEPITLEMRRVRIADEVNSATWVTERIEPSVLLSGAPIQEAPRDAADGSQFAEPVGEFFIEEEIRPLRTSKARAVALFGVSLVLAAGMVVLVGGRSHAQAKGQSVEPALVPIALTEIMAGVRGGIEVPGEVIQREPDSSEEDVDENGLVALSDAPSAPAPRPGALPGTMGSQGAAGAARRTEQSKDPKRARGVAPGTPVSNDKPNLVTYD